MSTKWLLSVSTKRYLGEDLYCSFWLKWNHFCHSCIWLRYGCMQNKYQLYWQSICKEFPKIYYLGLSIHHFFVILQGPILGRWGGTAPPSLPQIQKPGRSKPAGTFSYLIQHQKRLSFSSLHTYAHQGAFGIKTVHVVLHTRTQQLRVFSRWKKNISGEGVGEGFFEGKALYFCDGWRGWFCFFFVFVFYSSLP